MIRVPWLNVTVEWRVRREEPRDRRMEQSFIDGWRAAEECMGARSTPMDHVLHHFGRLQERLS